MQNKNPQNKWDNINKKPPQKIQIMLRIKLPAPPPYITSLPKGHNASPANLKACRPIGIPIIVTQQITPEITHPRAIINPPNKNQIKFPIIFIKIHLQFILQIYILKMKQKSLFGKVKETFNPMQVSCILELQLMNR